MRALAVALVALAAVPVAGAATSCNALNALLPAAFAEASGPLPVARVGHDATADSFGVLVDVRALVGDHVTVEWFATRADGTYAFGQDSAIVEDGEPACFHVDEAYASVDVTARGVAASHLAAELWAG